MQWAQHRTLAALPRKLIGLCDAISSYMAVGPLITFGNFCLIGPYGLFRGYGPNCTFILLTTTTNICVIMCSSDITYLDSDFNVYISFICRVGVFESCMTRSSQFWFSLHASRAGCFRYWCNPWSSAYFIVRECARLNLSDDKMYCSPSGRPLIFPILSVVAGLSAARVSACRPNKRGERSERRQKGEQSPGRVRSRGRSR